MRKVLAPFLLLIFVTFTPGCIPANNWHEATFSSQLAYVHPNAEILRADLDRTLNFLPTIGLKRQYEPTDGTPVTESIFIRDLNDHFHVTVTLRGLTQLNGPGYIMIVHVDSYNIGEEGAILAGQSLLNEIDKWHNYVPPDLIFRPSTGSTSKLEPTPAIQISPATTQTQQN